MSQQSKPDQLQPDQLQSGSPGLPDPAHRSTPLSTDSPSASPAPPSTTRLASLDALRGLAIAGMILVTDPGTYSARYAQLAHAEWQGGTATDMIFPAFLWIAGVAIPFSLAAPRNQGHAQGHAHGHVQRRILRRVVLLILLGLLVNGFPLYHLHILRIPGILQRIAVCYGAAALLVHTLAPLIRTVRRQALTFAGLACLCWVLYAVLLFTVPTPGFGAGRFDPLGSLPDWLDRLVFTQPHLWPYGLLPGGIAFRDLPVYDSEGILSTLPALGTTLIGVAAGVWLRHTKNWRQCALHFALAGVVLITAGFACGTFLPIVKKLWTPSFAMLAAGVSFLVFAALYALLDGLRRGHRALVPLRIFGTNSILAFTLSSILTSLLSTIHWRGHDLHQTLYATLFAGWLPPRPASLAYAIAIVLVNLLLLLPLYRRRIFLRL